MQALRLAERQHRHRAEALVDELLADPSPQRRDALIPALERACPRWPQLRCSLAMVRALLPLAYCELRYWHDALDCTTRLALADPETALTAYHELLATPFGTDPWLCELRVWIHKVTNRMAPNDEDWCARDEICTNDQVYELIRRLPRRSAGQLMLYNQLWYYLEHGHLANRCLSGSCCCELRRQHYVPPIEVLLHMSQRVVSIAIGYVNCVLARVQRDPMIAVTLPRCALERLRWLAASRWAACMPDLSIAMTRLEPTV